MRVLWCYTYNQDGLGKLIFNRYSIDIQLIFNRYSINTQSILNRFPRRYGEWWVKQKNWNKNLVHKANQKLKFDFIKDTWHVLESNSLILFIFNWSEFSRIQKTVLQIHFFFSSHLEMWAFQYFRFSEHPSEFSQLEFSFLIYITAQRLVKNLPDLCLIIISQGAFVSD